MSAKGKAEFERTLTVSDIQSELGVGVSTARSFLKTFGFRFGCHMVIRQPAFRLLQADGTVALWVKGHAGHPYNERCDTLAQDEAEKFRAPHN